MSSVVPSRPITTVDAWIIDYILTIIPAYQEYEEAATAQVFYNQQFTVWQRDCIYIFESEDTTMANKTLFASLRGALIPQTERVNSENAPAYALAPKQALAQYAATGCFGRTFYATADEQLTRVLELCDGVDPRFVAQLAIYSRTQSFMKDMPALLCAWLVRARRPAARSRVRARDRQHAYAADLRSDSSFGSGRPEVVGNCSQAAGARVARQPR